MTPSRPLSDAELDARIRAAGALLDTAAERRAATRSADRRRTEHRSTLVLAAVVLAALAIGGAAVLALRTGDDPADRVRVATTTTEATTPQRLRQQILDLGLTGLVVSNDVGLVDLATGEVTPLVSPGDILRDGHPLAVSDGHDGLYYLSLDLDADPEDPDDFGRTDLRHLGADGTDEVVQQGVGSFALRADGALALSVARTPIMRNGATEWPFDIVVQDPDGTRTTWSPSPGGYHVTAWAGDRLVGERDLEDTEARDGIVFDGPGQVRDLAHEGGVSAIGPDGTWAVVGGVAPGEVAPEPGAAPIPPRVLDLATGAVIGTIDHGAVAAGPGTLVWSGPDRLVGATAVPVGSDPDAPVQRGAVVELSVAGGGGQPVRITEERTLVLDERTYTPTEAAEAPDGALLAIATAVGPSPGATTGSAIWACRPRADTCDLVPLPFGERGDVGFVADPSRPSAGG